MGRLGEELEAVEAEGLIDKIDNILHTFLAAWHDEEYPWPPEKTMWEIDGLIQNHKESRRKSLDLMLFNDTTNQIKNSGWPEREAQNG